MQKLFILEKERTENCNNSFIVVAIFPMAMLVDVVKNKMCKGERLIFRLVSAT